MIQSLIVDRRRCIGGLGLLATGLFLRPALAHPAVQRASRQLLGTRVDLVVQGSHAGDSTVAIDAALAEMGRLERMMSRYRADSQVSALNRAAGRNEVEVAPELMAVLKQARQVAALSQGRFDITVGVFQGWDFTPGQTRIASEPELARQSALVNYRDLQLDEQKLQARLLRSDMKVDLGGIAKLPILQAGMDQLRRHGISNAMINGGGDVLTMGQLQGQDWRVGLRDPRAPERVIGIIRLSDGVIASSGDYERAFVHNGQRYHHVLDPRTGKPTQGVRGVAMVARSIEAVNGLGTAVMVAGNQAGRQLLESQAGVDSLIVAADSQLWMSGRMRHRLQPAAKA